jgi:hypothetical protein
MKWLTCKQCKKDYWGCETHQTIWRRNYCDQACKQASLGNSLVSKQVASYIFRLSEKELGELLTHVKTGAFDLKEVIVAALMRKGKK